MQNVKEVFQSLVHILNKKYVHVLIIIIILLLSSATFAWRYFPAFEIPNFYAEDGKVFVDNVLHKNPLQAILTAFNGYLIVGLYALVEIAVFLQRLLGLSFVDLPILLALMSCLFLGLTSTLPYILLRKQFGVISTLLMVVATTLVAVPSFDYAIIGAIGNLKFLFLLWAFYFILYRNASPYNLKRVIFADALLLFSVFTYAPAVALLPFALWPYRKDLFTFIKKRNFKALPLGIVSVFTLAFVSFVYLLVVYVKEIPVLPGYLDTPYQVGATVKLMYRTTFYGILTPLTGSMRDLITIGLILIVSFMGLRWRNTRFITLFGLWSLFIATVAFVANRQGISNYFMHYGPNPDQFFYAQTLIFTFLLIVILRRKVNSLSRDGKVITIVLICLLVWWNLPAIGSYGKNRALYEHLGTSQTNIETACKTQTGKYINFQIYPSAEWRWTIERSMAC